MRDRVVSGVVIAFLAVGCILPACGVMPGTKLQIETLQLDERVAELERKVEELQKIPGRLKLFEDDLAALTSEQQQLATGLGEAFSAFGVGGGYSPVPSGVGGGYSPVITEALDGITEALNVIAERNNYFYGKLMTVRDFEAEQAYLSERVGNIETEIEAMHIHGESTDAMIDYIDARLRLIEEELAVEPPPPPS